MQQHKRMKRFFIIMVLLSGLHVQAQIKVDLQRFSSIPDKEGMAGMFAGVSHGRLFCMGGANFPDKKPWEGGQKKWYDQIFMLTGKNEWKILDQKLPHPMAYGVSIAYNQEVILIGGNDDLGFHREVFGMEWMNERIHFKSYPSLPMPLANMAGAIVGNLIIVAGGTSSATGKPLSVVLGFDVKHPDAGWFTLPSWPGETRTQAVSASTKNHFYLFSGEAIGVDANGTAYRKILSDCFEFTPSYQDGKWTGTWKKLNDLLHGVSASANPAPVFNDRYILFWAGLDSTTASIKDPVTHPGFPKSLLIYDIRENVSLQAGESTDVSPVTLPAVKWKNKWFYISGEKRPGVRTNTIHQVSIKHH